MNRFTGAYVSFCLIVIVISAVFLFKAYELSEFYEELLAHGKTAIAVVSDKEKAKGSRGGTNFILLYSFPVERGGAFQARKFVTHSEWKNTTVGHRFAVTYLEHAPERHVPFSMTAEAARQPLLKTLHFIGIMAGIVGLPLFILLIRKSLIRKGLGRKDSANE